MGHVGGIDGVMVVSEARLNEQEVEEVERNAGCGLDLPPGYPIGMRLENAGNMYHVIVCRG